MQRSFQRAAILLMTCFLILSAGCAGDRNSIYEFDGYTVRTEKARETDAPQTETRFAAQRNEDGEIREYILNKSSMKFHDPECSGAESISEKNRRTYQGTRQSVIDMGYEPCRICNP